MTILKPPPSVPRKSSFFQWRGARSHRLATELAAYQVDIEWRKDRATESDALVLEQCLALLRRADSAHRRGSLGEGWAFLHEAQRCELDALSPEQRGARVVALRAEVKKKLVDWRQDAALELLGQPKEDEPDVDRVKEAVQLRNGHTDNRYHKLDLTREQLLILTIVLLAALVGLDLILGLARDTIGNLDWLRLLTVMVVGAMGGALSAVRSLAGRRDHKIPDELAYGLVTALRPLLGAAAATGIALLAQTGLVSFGAPDSRGPALLAVAFLAGFSERWFLGVIESVSGGAKSDG